MAQTTLEIVYCDTTGTTNVIFPDSSSSSCVSGGQTREITAERQTVTFNFTCPVSAISTDLLYTNASNSASFSVTRNEGSIRTYIINVTFVDGSTLSLYIVQSARRAKSVEVPVSEHYSCYNGNKVYSYRRMFSYDGGETWEWSVPPIYSPNYNHIYESGSSDCSDGEYAWNDTQQTYCLDGTLYTVKQKVQINVTPIVYTDEFKLGDAIGDCSEPAEGYEYIWLSSGDMTICGENTSGGTGGNTGSTAVTVTDKWIESGRTCSGYSLYVKEVHVYSYDGETFLPTYPPEIRLGELIQEKAEACGWQLSTKWEQSGTTCSEYSLRELLVKYVSEDDGETWTLSDPVETKLGAIVQTGVTECGWIDIEGLKYYALYNDDESNPYTIENDGTSVITRAEVQPEGRDVSALTKAVLGLSVTGVGSAAFGGCSALTSVSMTDYVTNIATSAFANTSGLESILLSNRLQTIGVYAFRGSGLKSVSLPGSVTNIGMGAFLDCGSMVSLTCKATTPPHLGINALAGNFTIFVPYSALSTYQVAWGDYASRIQGFIDGSAIEI